MNLSAATYILEALAAGDFNADGLDDLALAVDNLPDSGFPIRAEVLILRNTGNGFAAPADYRLPGLFPRCIEAADVTGDGVLDLVVCHARSVNDVVEGQISLLVGQSTSGQPNGAFLRNMMFSGAVGTAPAAVAIGDVDKDGRQDLVVADPDDDVVFLFYGTGGPEVFGAPVALAEVADPVTPLLQTVAGRALPQILVTSASKLLTFAQTAPRVFSAPSQPPVIGFQPADMALGRIDADATDDLVVVSLLGAELWHGETNGTFTFAESLTDDSTLDRLALADLNGDGKLDVAASASTRDRVTVVLNGADVPFTPAPTATITPTPAVTGTPTPTPSGGTPGATFTATPTGGGSGCAGDCNGNGGVVVNELIQGVNIALDNAGVATCPAFDLDGNGQVAVNELIAAVNAALAGCPAAT